MATAMDNKNFWAEAGLDSSFKSFANRLDGLPCKFCDLPQSTQDSFIHFFKHVLPSPICPRRASSPELEHVTHFRYFNNKHSDTKRVQPRFICKSCPAKRPTLKDPYFEFTLTPEEYVKHLTHHGGLLAIVRSYIEKKQSSLKNNSNTEQKKKKKGTRAYDKSDTNQNKKNGGASSRERNIAGTPVDGNNNTNTEQEKKKVTRAHDKSDTDQNKNNGGVSSRERNLAGTPVDGNNNTNTEQEKKKATRAHDKSDTDQNKNDGGSSTRKRIISTAADGSHDEQPSQKRHHPTMNVDVNNINIMVHEQPSSNAGASTRKITLATGGDGINHDEQPSQKQHHPTMNVDVNNNINIMVHEQPSSTSTDHDSSRINIRINIHKNKKFGLHIVM